MYPRYLFAQGDAFLSDPALRASSAGVLRSRPPRAPPAQAGGSPGDPPAAVGEGRAVEHGGRHGPTAPAARARGRAERQPRGAAAAARTGCAQPPVSVLSPGVEAGWGGVGAWQDGAGPRGAPRK